MVSLGLTVPYYGVRVCFTILPNSLWIISFLLFFQMVFSWLRTVFLTCIHWSVLYSVAVWGHLQIARVLCVQFYLWWPVHELQLPWISLSSYLHLLNSGSCLHTTWVSSLYTSPWNSFKAVGLAKPVSQTSLSLLPDFRFLGYYSLIYFVCNDCFFQVGK